jgi:hypothetical protein
MIRGLAEAKSGGARDESCVVSWLAATRGATDGGGAEGLSVFSCKTQNNRTKIISEVCQNVFQLTTCFCYAVPSKLMLCHLGLNP